MSDKKRPNGNRFAFLTVRHLDRLPLGEQVAQLRREAMMIMEIARQGIVVDSSVIPPWK